MLSQADTLIKILDIIMKFESRLLPFDKIRRSSARATTILGLCKRFSLKLHYGSTLLDVGSGDQAITKVIASTVFNTDKIYPYDVYGFKSIKSADPLFLPNKYKYVVMFMSLHHLSHVTTSLKVVYNAMQPGGLLFIREHDTLSPNYGHFLEFVHLFYATINKEDVTNVVRFGQFYMSRKTLISMCQLVGFKLIGSTIVDKRFLRSYTIVFGR